ncbi:serine/threonine-protein kinase LMTK1 isoform X2 [Xenopus laevis]|uniref:non-specific serine/threonine protein kinase n=1 Tax=Xenopus laevis TaxID=8355 RepID=A0A8J1M1D5_XENLA|nr:serine/threonine-protein kinase LMTK1 isoform X2 [Xenopus laevis]
MAVLLALIMSSLFNLSFAFSSHFDSDGTQLSELSWPSSLAVVAVSFSGIITFIFLMLACLCCKKGDIGFKELDNVEGEDNNTELSIQSSPAAQNGPEVYVLPLTEISVPMSKQPGRSVQLLKSTDLGRQSLLYLKEIGFGWFGKVLLGEVNSGLSSTQVVVKELKVSASVQEQMLFLEEIQPYRVLQHANVLQCLAQCAEITPYLLVMEFCPLGDLKGYLQSCAASESTAPDPLTLQRMGCEVCCGLLHLHKHNYTHSDLALRNCLLAADLSVKIGDYGLAHSKYRDDYLVTSDQLWVPLRWIAPELIDEVHGNLLVVDQTKASNIWSLGVTLWELFEFGKQPYPEYSDRQVLCYVIKEQQLKLPRPQLKHLHSDRWFEVMQFCWLQPEQRPTAEEVHLLLSYLTVKGASELEEEFEKRWNSMKPTGGSGSCSHHEAELSSYPLLEHFSSDGFHTDGDDVLTVTQTSQGLNFEYKWERGKHEQYPLNPGCPPYQDMYITSSTEKRLSQGVSPSCYENKEGNSGPYPHEVVPVFSAHSPSVAGDYYICIEEPLNSNIHRNCSPQYGEHPTQENKYTERANLSNNSTSISLSMEPLMVETICSDKQDKELHRQVLEQDYECSKGADTAEEKILCEPSKEEEFCSVVFVDPLGASPTLKQLCQASLGSAVFKNLESEDKISNVCKTQLDSATLKLEHEGETQQYNEFKEDLPTVTSNLVAFSPHWASNISSNNNISTAPLDFSSASWCNRRSSDSQKVDKEPYGPESWQNMEPGEGEPAGSLAELECHNKTVADGEECRDWLEKTLNISLTPSEEKMIDLKITHTDYTEPLLSPMECPTNAERDSEHKTDPRGASIIGYCTAHAQPEAMHSFDIFKEGESFSVYQEICSPVLTDEFSGQGISPIKERESPEESFPTDLYQNESDDEDTMEITSGVFTDLSSERGDIVQPFRSLQKQVGTPDSLDSLDMPSTGSSCEAFNLGAYTCGQHKALDSGYDTENYESPEFVLKEPTDSRDTDAYYQINQAHETDLGSEEMTISRSVSSDLQGLDAKNPYRDSAYFSDYDSFTREEEEVDGDQEVEGVTKEKDSLEVHNSNLDTYSDDKKTDTKSSVTCQDQELPDNSSSLPTLLVPQDCVLVQPQLMVGQESVDEGLGLECQKEHSIEKRSPLPSIVESSSHRTFTLSPVQLCLPKECTIKQGNLGSITLTTGLQMDESVISCSKDSLSTRHVAKCLSPPFPRKDGKGGASLDEEDDEESEDSDDSDEELRCYNIQEHSEESEEEHGIVPIVITDNGSSGQLRSLLKIPSFLPEPDFTEFDRKKKVVSFYDDVTVYLFDQESPTRELADQDFPEMPPSNGQSTVQQEVEQRACMEPGDRPLLEEKCVGFEWQDDFHLTKLRASFVTSLSPAIVKSENNSLPAPVPIQKPALPVQFSRFSVSPTSLSRFSITQVADSDLKSVGGNGDPGERV